LLRELLPNLRSARSPSRESSEILDEHEQALRRLFPHGAPSGDGSAQFDRLINLRHQDVQWQLAVRRWFQIAGLIGTFVSLAVGIALALSYFAS
jgi:hypothetical protein